MYYDNYYGYSPYDTSWYDDYQGGPYYVSGAPSSSSSLVSSSTIAKVAIVAGGALAILFIFRASRAAEKLEPIHERAGRMAGKALRARYSGGRGSGGGRGSARGALGSGSEVESLTAPSYKLLTA